MVKERPSTSQLLAPYVVGVRWGNLSFTAIQGSFFQDTGLGVLLDLCQVLPSDLGCPRHSAQSASMEAWDGPLWLCDP